jgi:hypothetical protein
MFNVQTWSKYSFLALDESLKIWPSWAESPVSSPRGSEMLPLSYRFYPLRCHGFAIRVTTILRVQWWHPGCWLVDIVIWLVSFRKVGQGASLREGRASWICVFDSTLAYDRAHTHRSFESAYFGSAHLLTFQHSSQEWCVSHSVINGLPILDSSSGVHVGKCDMRKA